MILIAGTGAASAQCTGIGGIPFNCAAGATPQIGDYVLGGSNTGAQAGKTVRWTVGQILGLANPYSTTSNASIGGNFSVTGTSSLTGNLSVLGTSTMLGGGLIDNGLVANNGLYAYSGTGTGNSIVLGSGGTAVTGNATIGGTLGVTGNLSAPVQPTNATLSTCNASDGGEAK